MIDNPDDKQYPNKVYNVGLINRAKAREYILDLCSKLKPQYTRISPEFLSGDRTRNKNSYKRKNCFLRKQKENVKVNIMADS